MNSSKKITFFVGSLLIATAFSQCIVGPECNACNMDNTECTTCPNNFWKVAPTNEFCNICPG